MSNLEKKISLPPESIRLYQIISASKNIAIKELELQTKLDRGKLEYYISFLDKENLVERNSIIYQNLVLTEEGKSAASKELIERRILSALKEKQPVLMADLAEILGSDKNELNAGIGYLRKLDLVKIDKGQVSLLDRETEVSKELQIILEQLFDGKEIDVNELKDILLERNLVVIEEAKDFIFEIKVPYSNVKDKIVEATDISRLTPNMIRDGSWREIRLREYNLEVSPPSFYIGRKQLYAQFLDEVKRKLVGLGFLEMRGPPIEMEFWNFDALFQAQDHPAREWSDVYKVSNPKQGILPKEDFVENVRKVHENGFDTGSKGWRYKWDPKKSARLVLRAQGTSVSARTLVNLEIPSKYFSISRCYRPDTVDATHLSEFNQAEGIVADPSITFRDLLGILKTFALDVAEVDNYRFKPDYYPFTAPSVELSTIDPYLGRIEFGGAGIFRPEVTRPFKIEVPVIAWGLGIDRLFMAKYGITDIRELYSYKLEWLRSTKMS